ncbi:MAG TPA: hypothetical protein VHM92_09870 [Allosphingosinicella sp.]|nr:hypothetical protein [Allosphingosinicella sp.]
MRRIETILGAAIWIAASALLPMVALEPVRTGAAANADTKLAARPCPEGSAGLATGCRAVQL